MNQHVPIDSAPMPSAIMCSLCATFLTFADNRQLASTTASKLSAGYGLNESDAMRLLFDERRKRIVKGEQK